MIDVTYLAELARQAGEAILEVYHREGEVAVQNKSDSSPLTEADERSHQVIVKVLAERYPHIPVVSEEDGGGHATERQDGDYWLIDPLDGTKEFIKRTGEFTVNIALVRDGMPVIGVVYAPVLGVTWIGTGESAERWEGDAHTAMRVTAPADGDRLRVVASRDHAGAAVKAMLEKLPGAETLSMGSSLKFCLIAEGRADLYFRDGPTMPWDTAAAHAVLRSAGGDVFAVNGAALRYYTPRVLNPQFVAIGDLALPWSDLISVQHTP